MAERHLHYALVLPVQAFRLGGGRFAVESAFADHLRLLLQTHTPRFSTITFAGPVMSKATYEQRRTYLAEIDPSDDAIRFVGLYRAGTSHAEFVRGLSKTIEKLRRVVSDADLVQTGVNPDLTRPVEFCAAILAHRLGKKTVSVTDIDNRDAARMLRASGQWSRREYLANRWIYDPIRDWQQRKLVEECSLVLLKGRRLVQDYGRGADHVKFFQNTAYTEAQVISEEELARRCEDAEHSNAPLKLTHFGRLELYKGMHHAIEALSLANAGARPVAQLTLIGMGSEEPSLRRLAADLGVDDAVHFCPPMGYGEAFLNRVRAQDMLIAPSLAPDTPRSAWDAIASGIPILAYDTAYYRELRDLTGCVHTVPRGDVGALADAIRSFAQDRKRVVEMKWQSRVPALENAQERWLARRVAWTDALFSD